MIDITMVSVPGCAHCERAKEIFRELEPTYPDRKLTEVDATTPEGMEPVQKHSIFSSPGILVNGEFFSSGGLNRKAFVKKLESLKGQ